jgi:dihydropteroate synthase
MMGGDMPPFLLIFSRRPATAATLNNGGAFVVPIDVASATLVLPDRQLRFDRVLVMGVLNVTPDSFSDGGRFLDPDVAAERAAAMVEEGADLIDVGGESTRPFAKPVAAAEEWRRVAPVLRRLPGRVDVPLSVDTYKPEIAAKALELGVQIVNDVTGLADPAMRRVVADAGAAAVVMHMQGTPETMQVDPRYDDVVADVKAFLVSRTREAMAAGVGRESIVVDPGFGFGKTPEDNLALLRDLGSLRDLGFPVLAGLSRKSFVGRATAADVGERLAGSVATAVYAALQGAHILRVHDVKETVMALRLVDALRRHADR